MKVYEFSLVLAGAPELTLELSGALFASGCDDDLPWHCEGVTRVVFDREAPFFEAAVRSAIANVRAVGCQVKKIEFDVERVDQLAPTAENV